MFLILEIIDLLKKNLKKQEEIMSAIDSLNEAVNGLQTTVELAIKKIDGLKEEFIKINMVINDDIEIRKAVDAINAEKEKLNQATS